MSEASCRRIVGERSGGLCERCCRGGGLTLHHRKKRSHLPKAKVWEPANCVMLCGHGTSGCHGWVEHNPNAAEAEGLHVRPWQDPAAVPILYHGSQRALLTSDGGVDYDAADTGGAG